MFVKHVLIGPIRIFFFWLFILWDIIREELLLSILYTGKWADKVHQGHTALPLQSLGQLPGLSPTFTSSSCPKTVPHGSSLCPIRTISPVKQREREIIGIGSCDMKAKETHRLPSSSWRTRAADAVIQSQFKGLRTRVTNGRSCSLSPVAPKSERVWKRSMAWVPAWAGGPEDHECHCSRPGGDHCPSPWRQHVHPPWPLCSLQTLHGLDDAHGHWAGPSCFLSLWIQMLFAPRHTQR